MIDFSEAIPQCTKLVFSIKYTTIKYSTFYKTMYKLKKSHNTYFPLLYSEAAYFPFYIV